MRTSPWFRLPNTSVRVRMMRWRQFVRVAAKFDRAVVERLHGWSARTTSEDTYTVEVAFFAPDPVLIALL